MNTASSVGDPDADPVALLERWETFGASWDVVSRSQGSVTVALYRCDGGEEVERFTSTDPRLLALIEARARELPNLDA